MVTGTDAPGPVHAVPAGADRHLGWDGCVNVRDLGGLPTEDGLRTRFGVVVRSDDISMLSEKGREALRAHGVRTAIDLRSAEERAACATREVAVPAVAIPLFGRLDQGGGARIDRILRTSEDAATALRSLYEDALVFHAVRIGRVMTAVAAALDEGAVVVHCAIGKDRTGIVSALLLRLAGVSIEEAADDYALSGSRVTERVVPWVEGAPDEAHRRARQRAATAPRAGMVGMLRTVDDRHGGVRRLLEDADVPRAALDVLRTRLRSG